MLVVATISPISANVPGNPCQDDLLAALERDDRVNTDNSAHHLGLPRMTRQAVQHDLTLIVPALRFEKLGQDTFSQREVTVFQQCARLQNVPEEPALLRRKGGNCRLIPRDPAEIGAEVEMAESAAAQPSGLDPVAQRRLAGAGWPQ